ncbi:MAG: hypothetical protein HUJ68_08675 [Clostridia bacterium]|nr:hypothetical protein [Clostridia bacterium]
MSGYVEECAKELEKIVGEGKVEILDDAWLRKANEGFEKTFHIDAYDAKFSNGDIIHFDAKDWTVDEAFNDMRINYKKFKTNYIITNIPDIKKIPMYKVNQAWIIDVKNKGYEIIDIGYPQGLSSESVFYNMELKTVNF